MSFAYPLFLWTLVPLLMVLMWLYRRRWRCFAIVFPWDSGSQGAVLSGSGVAWWRRAWAHVGGGLWLLAMVALVVAFARPQVGQEPMLEQHDGLDIVLVLDTSESMRAEDFIMNQQRMTRWDAVQAVVHEFIDKRRHDRLGLVIFGSRAYPLAPLTWDHGVLKQFLAEASIGMAGKSTAIGDAIGVASNRLKRLNAPSKVMILLTDGSQTAGTLKPEQAADAAKSLGIKIYTIGIAGKEDLTSIGGMLTAFMSVYHGVTVDEETLKAVAERTGGQYFYAATTEDLRAVYNTIGELETTVTEEWVYGSYKELFMYPAWMALILMLLSLLWGTVMWWRVP